MRKYYRCSIFSISLFNLREKFKFVCRVGLALGPLGGYLELGSIEHSQITIYNGLANKFVEFFFRQIPSSGDD